LYIYTYTAFDSIGLILTALAAPRFLENPAILAEQNSLPQDIEFEGKN
jgi:hypothetical protein